MQFLYILLALWPAFFLIGFGLFLQKSGFLASAFWEGAERLNYYFLFPALLISGMAKAPFFGTDLHSIAGLSLLMIAVIWGVLLLLKKYSHWETKRFGVLTQSALRFNTYLGLSVVNAIYGTEGLAIAAIVMAIKIPVVNFISVYALTADRQVSVVKIMIGVIRNPLIQACLIGVFLNFTGIGLPAGSAELLRIMGSGSLPLGLLCIGAALQTSHMFGERWVMLKAAVVKLILIPTALILVARLFGWQSQEIAIVVIFFALPAAPTAYILVRQMNGDSTLMAGVIAMQTFFCMLTLPVLVVALLHWL